MFIQTNPAKIQIFWQLLLTTQVPSNTDEYRPIPPNTISELASHLLRAKQCECYFLKPPFMADYVMELVTFYLLAISGRAVRVGTYSAFVLFNKKHLERLRKKGQLHWIRIKCFSSSHSLRYYWSVWTCSTIFFSQFCRERIISVLRCRKCSSVYAVRDVPYV